MFLSLALTVAVLWLPAAVPQTLTTDLDGDGTKETATAQLRGKKVFLQISDSAGKPLAESAAPAPDSGASDIALTMGSLGSAGALLEVVASGAGTECRSLWRYRGERLSRIPVHETASPLSDCQTGAIWSSRWEKLKEDAPANYVRERSRSTPYGLYHQVQVFRFTGFRLDLDGNGSAASIGGVPIPAWHDVVLYPKATLDGLYNRFDLSSLKSAPHLHVRTDPSEGVFALDFESPAFQERFPIRASAPGEEKDEVVLTAGSAGRAACVRVLLTAKGTVPSEVLVDGLGAGLDSLYVPISRFRGEALRVYESAEQELAAEALVGTWSSETGQRVTVTPLSGSPPTLRFGSSKVSVSLDGCPPGVDLLLVPMDGSRPGVGLTLRGPRTILRVPLRCARYGMPGAEPCERAGPSETLYLLGSLMNNR